FLKIKYFISEKEGGTISKKPLANYAQKYGKIFPYLPSFGVGWSVFGVILTINAFYREKLVDASDYDFLFNSITAWIVITGIILAIVPISLLLKTIDLPRTIKEEAGGTFAKLILVVVITGLIAGIVTLELNFFAIVMLLLLLVPTLISAWFAGEFYAIFTIRQYYKMKGWDYIAGKPVGKGAKGKLMQGLSGVSFILALLTPILALNTFIGLFAQSNDTGGPLGSVTDGLVANWFQSLIIFLLLLGPLLAIATQPAGFLELTLNSEVYSTLAKFDWEEFNRRSNKAQEIINIQPYSKRIMSGVLVLFIGFLMYVSILSLGGLVTEFNLTIGEGLEKLPQAIKFIEIPILLLVIFRILRSLVEEKEIMDIANLGLKEKRDVTSWMFWALENIYIQNYEKLDKNLDELLADPVTAENHRVYFFKGLLEAYADDNKKAEEYFTKATELKPDWADGWLEVSVTRYFQGKHHEALEPLLKAAKLKKGWKTAHFNLGRLYDVLGEPEKALKSYQRSIKIDSEDAKVWANMVAIYIKLEQQEKAIEVAKKALKYDPDDHVALINMAIAYKDLGQIEESQKIQDSLLKTHGDNVAVLQSIATDRLIKEEYQEAIEVNEKIIKLGLVDAINLPNIAQAYYKAGDLQSTVNIIEEFLEKYPEHLMIRFLLGEVYMDANVMDKALEQFEFIVEKDESFETALLKLGSCYGRLNLFEDALVALERARVILPNDPDVFFNLGLSKAMTDKTDFDEDYERALELKYDNHYLSIWIQSKSKFGTISKEWLDETIAKYSKVSSEQEVVNTIGQSYRTLNMREEAVHFLERAVALEVNYKIMNDLAILYLQGNELEEAQKLLLTVIEDEKSAGAYNNLAITYLNQGDGEKALELFLTSHEQFPEDNQTIGNISAVLTQGKRYEEAIPYFRIIAEREPLNYGVIVEIARCLALVGQTEQSKEEFNKALVMAKQEGNEQAIAQIKEFLGYLEGNEEE
ncbi:MAG: tetratricopeptide repeat protein, partial [Candidatus Kariarchaeaceae archaeon]